MPDVAGSARRFARVRRRTTAVAAPLSPEDQVVQSMPDASPVKWHLAHTTWFFDTFVLEPHLAGWRTPDPTYTFLFNSYYEAVGPRHTRDRRGLLTRPSVDDVADYRVGVDAAVGDLLAGLPDEVDHPTTRCVLDLIELGCQHEEQHQELALMDVAHLLGQHPFPSAYRTAGAPAPAADPGPVGWVEHPGGRDEVGHDGDGFAFDNEGPRHPTWLAPFALADRLTTAGEWLAFMEDGGYERPELWLSDGWAEVRRDGLAAPMGWRIDGDAWVEHTLHGVRPLDRHAPVVRVSRYEADAYARWAGARLPTEAEWEVVARTHWTDPDPDTAWPTDTPLHPGTTTGGGVRDLHGTVWQWTASGYDPYPGFHPAPGAVGEYNGKFMVNQYVLRGGSVLTPPGHARPTYRNFFPAGARWVYAGVRLARDGDAA